MNPHDPLVDDEPADTHDLTCAIWVSADPADTCDCGADDEQHNPRSPQLLTTAQRLDRIPPEPVALVCDTDTDNDDFQETA